MAHLLLQEGHTVVGVDNLNHYYDPRLKEWRIRDLEKFEGFTFHLVDISDFISLEEIFKKHHFDAVINEAARAGVRASIENPWVYVDTNVKGTLNVLELMKKYGVQTLIQASTSSLYAGSEPPFKEDLPVNTPISPYAATKKGAEALCYTYHYLYRFNVTVLRYFTVYGPAGRPDMSVFRFIYKTLKGEPFEVFGDGTQERDFTYIDDIARGTIKALNLSGFNVINLGNDNPKSLNYLIDLIRVHTHKDPKVVYKDFHKADMKKTWAHIEKAKSLLGWKPEVSLEEGVKRTVEWFRENWNWVKDLKI